MFVVLLHFYSADPTPAYGEIASVLRRRGHTVWVGQPASAGGFAFLDGADIVARIPASLGRVRALPFMLSLRSRLRNLAPDVVQITPHPWSWLLAACNPAKTVFVNDIRTAGSGTGAGFRAWLVDASAWLSWRAGAAAFYDATFFLNDTGARWLFGSGWTSRAHVVPLGVGAPFLEAATQLAVASDGVVQFVYLGTLSGHRNLGQILAAARQLLAKTGRFRLTLVGPDDGVGGLTAVRQLVDRDGLQSVVTILGPVTYDRVPNLLRSFDVALNYLPATRVMRRQTSMKVLECRALGLPQITTRTGPNAAVVGDGANGLLVDDSADAYAAAMARVIDEPGLLDRLRRAAESTRDGVPWIDVGDRQLAIYEGLAAGRSAGR